MRRLLAIAAVLIASCGTPDRPATIHPVSCNTTNATYGYYMALWAGNPSNMAYNVMAQTWLTMDCTPS